MSEDTTGNTASDGTMENESNSSTKPPEGETQPKPEDNKPSAKTYSEAEYKGLQTVIAKRDATIKDKDTLIAELTAKLAEAEANHGSAVSEKTSLTQKLTESTDKVTNLEKTVADLEKKLNYQNIVMKDFPDLAPAIDFLPRMDSEEEFREKAKELRATLKQYVGNEVKQVISGASPPLSGDGEGSTLGGDELDKLYREAVRLAGVPGKEQEYEAAYQKYLNFKKNVG